MSSLPPAGLAAHALQASFQRSYRQLLAFLTRKTGCAEDARELTQDLWLQLQRRTPPVAGNPEAYLFTMARNLALDHLRRRQLATEHGDAWRALHPDEPQHADAPLLLAQRRVLGGVAARWQTELASAVGRQLQQALPDGSRILLDADGRAQLAYDARTRHVVLAQGAAFFDVVRDAGRPFVVEASHLRVTVLGTRFAVDIREGGPAGTEVEVTVESGRVRVEPRAGAAWPALELQAGDSLSSLAQGTPHRRSGLARAAGWREGWLGLRDAPLGQVARRLQRYTGQPIVVTPRAAAMPVTAEIRIAQAGEWLQALPRAMPLRVEPHAGGWRIAER